jgi:heme O synthase-like polyprenyltransferase
MGAGFMAKIAARSDDEAVAAARRLFFASIVYLPLVLGALVLDKSG